MSESVQDTYSIGEDHKKVFGVVVSHSGLMDSRFATDALCRLVDTISDQSAVWSLGYLQRNCRRLRLENPVACARFTKELGVLLRQRLYFMIFEALSKSFSVPNSKLTAMPLDKPESKKPLKKKPTPDKAKKPAAAVAYDYQRKAGK